MFKVHTIFFPIRFLSLMFVFILWVFFILLCAPSLGVLCWWNTCRWTLSHGEMINAEHYTICASRLLTRSIEQNTEKKASQHIRTDRLRLVLVDVVVFLLHFPFSFRSCNYWKLVYLLGVYSVSKAFVYASKWKIAFKRKSEWKKMHLKKTFVDPERYKIAIIKRNETSQRQSLQYHSLSLQSLQSQYYLWFLLAILDMCCTSKLDSSKRDAQTQFSLKHSSASKLLRSQCCVSFSRSFSLFYNNPSILSLFSVVECSINRLFIVGFFRSSIFHSQLMVWNLFFPDCEQEKRP